MLRIVEFLKQRTRLVIGGLAVLIVALLVFNVLIDRYGAFWKSGVKQGKYPCPSVKQFCQNSQAVSKNDIYVGFGSKLPSGSPIYAAFDGQLTSVTTTLPPKEGEEKITAVYLENKTLELSAAYIFKGPAPALTSVKRGEEIGKVGDEVIFYGSNSLIFRLIKGDPVNGEPIQISSQDFAY